MNGDLALIQMQADARTMKSITFSCPDEIAAGLERLVESGWENSADEAIVAALQRYVRVRQPEVLEKHLEADIAWGLHGRE